MPPGMDGKEVCRVNTYYCPGAKMIRGQRVTIADRIRMRKARKRRGKEWLLFC